MSRLTLLVSTAGALSFKPTTAQPSFPFSNWAMHFRACMCVHIICVYSCRSCFLLQFPPADGQSVMESANTSVIHLQKMAASLLKKVSYQPSFLSLLLSHEIWPAAEQQLDPHLRSFFFPIYNVVAISFSNDSKLNVKWTKVQKVWNKQCCEAVLSCGNVRLIVDSTKKSL